MDKSQYIEKKQERREKKRKEKRSVQAEEVIFIFENILEEWKTVKIFNTLIQKNPNSLIDKKKVETISKGNCKIFPSELSEERYQYYCEIREKVYSYWSSKKNTNKIEPSEAN